MNDTALLFVKVGPLPAGLKPAADSEKPGYPLGAAAENPAVVPKEGPAFRDRWQRIARRRIDF